MTIATLVDQQSLEKSPFCTSTTSVFDAAVEIAEIDVNALAVVNDGALVVSSQTTTLFAVSPIAAPS